jgi:membrane-bound lytic murein transglycosylase B
VKRNATFVLVFFTVVLTPIKCFAASIYEQRKALVITHITKALGNDYAPGVVNDKRFAFDESLIPRRLRAAPPSETPKIPKVPKKPDYDYVFTDWSKEKGPTFMVENEAVLAYEEEQFHVPRAFIASIFNIETQWGKNLGPRPVTTTLYTRAVFWVDPKKRKWAEHELIVFLKLCKKNHWDPFSIKGSPTGAFGYPQFEPSSYPARAVGYRKHPGPPDLFDNADAICSAGNFLHKAGWGESEASRRKALHVYIHDPVYADAVLDYGDFLTNNTPPHCYHFTHPHVTAKKIERAAIK